MKIFDLTIENTQTKHIFKAQEYGNSIEEIKDFWEKFENQRKIGPYHLISCIETERN